MSERKPDVLIVGAAGGIGRATAKILCEKGFYVIAADINDRKLENLRQSGLEHLTTMELDISDRKGVLEMVAGFRETGHSFRTLVITAGIHSTHPVEYLTDDIIGRVLDVNLISHIKFVRDFLPLIEDGGSIVGVSSIAACVGVPMSSLYSASKWGLEGFYESLHAEVTYRRIRVSVIHPGNVNTGFNETGNSYEPVGNIFIDGHYNDVVSRIDSRYGIDPRRVAGVIVRVISMKSPRFCYVVGMNARKANWAKKILGRDLALKLMAKFFGF
ncbi:MAG: SDR family NAD(P)-dependent oxidoreductase [Candidatus Aegiribacteria sp.]|nr:SDR family NAD(P)-dependent oxidoreductase [Candidatus Aegiribacteria sp.]